jgi:hypothetical protein
MGFVIVPPDQKKVEVRLLDYANESDPGPFPIPDNAPIENWPLARNENRKALPKPGETLEQFQRAAEGDRHVLVVDPVNGRLHEFYGTKRTDDGWQALQASTWDLRTGALRPERWTSSDAAGLPVFPAVVHYDECARGMVEHAMRFTVRRTRRAFVLPATHWASQSRDPAHPRMGERFRLKKDFDVTGFPPHVQAILKGLKKHGMLVATTGAIGDVDRPDRRPRASRPSTASVRLEVVDAASGRSRDGRAAALPDRLRRARAGRARPVAAALCGGAEGPRPRRLLRPRPGARRVLPPRLRLRPRLHRPRRDARRGASGRRGRGRARGEDGRGGLAEAKAHGPFVDGCY